MKREKEGGKQEVMESVERESEGEHGKGQHGKEREQGNEISRERAERGRYR